MPHYTVIAFLIIQDVHYYLQGKLTNLGFVLVFFLLKNLSEYFIIAYVYFMLLLTALNQKVLTWGRLEYYTLHLN